MQMIDDDTRQVLDRVPRPIRTTCKRFLAVGSKFGDRGELYVAHMPWEGVEAYGLTIFPPMAPAALSEYEKLHSLVIPPKYRELLLILNGLFAFDLSLFGVPASMLQSPPKLDRSIQQCHDLETANRAWKHGYQVDPAWFHFGSRAYSEDANTGYFFDSKGWIRSCLEDGTQVGRWKAIDSYLKAELAAAEALVREDFPSGWLE